MEKYRKFLYNNGQRELIVIFSGLAILFFLPLVGFSHADQDLRTINLKLEKLPFTPTEYYLADIIDQRIDKTKVGMLLLPDLAGPQAVDLKGGGKASLSAYMLHSMPRDNSLRPIQVTIHQSDIIEKRGATGIIEGDIKLNLSFDFINGDEPIHLVNYRGGVSYRRSASQPGLVEPALRKSLGAAMQYFHDWIEKEAGENVLLTRGVNISIVDVVNNPDSDTVFHAKDRPLVFDDFRARPRPGSRFAASIFASFSFDVESEIVAGILDVKIRSKVFMLKDQSWARSESNNEYTLNHEQRHFDIAKIVMEKLKVTILNLEIYPDEWDSVINYYYLEAFREMNQLQDRYDKETRHGLDRGAQDRWNRMLDQALSTGVLALN